MKPVYIFFTFAIHTALGQAVIEDYKCSMATAITAGSPTIITCPSPHGIRLDIPKYYVYITGATGAWSGLNNFTGSVLDVPYAATIIDSSRIAVPFNSVGFSSFSGQITIRRASGDGNQMVQAYTGEDWSNTGAPDPSTGYFKMTVLGCPDKTNPNNCSFGYEVPDQSKQIIASRTISSFIVDTTGVATVVLSSSFPDIPVVAEVLQEGAMVWIVNMTNVCPPANQLPPYPHANPSVVSYCMFQAHNVNTSKTQFTINTPLPAGSYTGTNPYLAITQPTRPYIYVIPREMNGYPYPQGFIQNAIKSGTFNATMNRARFWVKWGKSGGLPPNGRQNISLGTYVRTTSDSNPGSVGAHYYHYNSVPAYSGVWQKHEFNLTTSHEVGAAATVNWPTNLTYVGHPFSPAWPGGPRHYMDALEVFYAEFEWPESSDPSQPNTAYFSQFELDTAPGEPEELVQARAGSWVPTRINTNDQGYEVYWTGPKYVNATYEMRYSTGGSLKSAGFSKGTPGGIVAAQGSAYQGVMWASPSMTQQANIWFGIRPTIPVWSASGSGQSPVWLITRVDTGMQAGDHVTSSGVTGNTTGNQSNSVVAAVQPRQIWWRFQPQPSTPWLTPSTLNSIVSDGSTCTVNLTVAHNLVKGWQIQVWGSTDPNLGGAGDMSFYKVSNIVAPNTFEFSCPGVAAGTYNTDYSDYVHLAVMSFPGLALSGTGNGDYMGGGSVVSTDDLKNFAEFSLTPTPPSSSGPTCDLNHDSVLNVLDIQLMINQAIGASSCTNDLNSDGKCDVIDVQRVVNAVGGAACRIGP
jgi:hypothetical protein